jgi:hypothetical protein
MRNPSLQDLILKFSLVVLGLIYPLIMLLWVGPQPSISAYFETPAQVLFLLVNAGTSFYFVNCYSFSVAYLTPIMVPIILNEFVSRIPNKFDHVDSNIGFSCPVIKV